MHLPFRSCAVLAWSANSHLQAVIRGHRARAVHGVLGVIVEPERARVLVRFDPLLTTADTIRRSVRGDDAGQNTGIEHWLALWPKLVHALPAAASML